MERGIVHDNNRTFWQLGQQILFGPCMKDVAIDIALKQGNGEQAGSNHGPYRIGAPLGSPILRPVAPPAALAVAMRARLVMGKATFVKIDNSLP